MDITGKEVSMLSAQYFEHDKLTLVRGFDARMPSSYFFVNAKYNV